MVFKRARVNLQFPASSPVSSARITPLLSIAGVSVFSGSCQCLALDFLIAIIAGRNHGSFIWFLQPRGFGWASRQSRCGRNNGTAHRAIPGACCDAGVFREIESTTGFLRHKVVPFDGVKLKVSFLFIPMARRRGQ